MKIAFHMDQICVRGTSVATYDYMKYNEELLYNQSILVLPESAKTRNDPLGIKRFSVFPIHYYADMNDLDRLLTNLDCKLLYCIKYGKNDGVCSKRVKTVVHCVFDMSEPHGDVYAGVSHALRNKFNSNFPFVPHMIGMKAGNPEVNLREELKIPKDAVVFGRYGGMDTFNIPFCWEAIYEIVHTRKDIFFLFINTPQYIKHDQIFYLGKIVTEEEKNKFINTCDAHLECGTLGHSFGCAIGEFSVNNKPIIAYKPVPNTLWNTSHLEILGDRGLYFKNKDEFKKMLLEFKPDSSKDWNCYRDYSPEKVMAIFENVFIK